MGSRARMKWGRPPGLRGSWRTRWPAWTPAAGLERSEEHTSEIQSPCNIVCRLLLGSEEHTSELQSPCNLVCRLLLEKNKTAHDLHKHKLHAPQQSLAGELERRC